MNKKATSSAGALYAASFAGAAVTAVSVSPHLLVQGYAQALLTLGLSLVVTSLAAVPALCIAREDISLPQTARLRLGKAGRLLTGFYFAVLVYDSFYFLAHFLIFAENTLDPAVPVWALAFCVVLAAAYGAWQGVAAVGRAGLFAFALMAAGFILIFLLLGKEVDFSLLYHTGPLQADLPSAVLFTAGRAASLVHLVLLSPVMRGRKVAGFWVMNTGFHVLCLLIVFFLAVCLGPMAAQQLFPVYTLAQLANVGAVQRLDILFLFLWIVGIVLRLCLDFLSAGTLFHFHDRQVITGKKERVPKKLWPVLGQAAAAAFAAALTADHLSLQRWLFSSQAITYVSLFAGVVVPLFILCLERAHRGRKEPRCEK